MVERWVLLNGSFCFEKEASIPITDRGFLFGEGIFTTIRVHQGKCELLKEHLQRLQYQADELKFTWTPLQLDEISELIQRNQAGEGTWRLKILLTVKEEGKARRAGCVLATLQPYEESCCDPCTLCLFPYVLQSPLAHIKSLAYLDHLFVRNFAHQHNYTDAITRTGDAILLETGCSNLFWIDQGQCWIPDPQLPYLKGVFLQALLRHLTLPVQFIKATIDQVAVSANVYICNALTHVRPVVSIDQRLFSRSQQNEILLHQAANQAIG